MANPNPYNGIPNPKSILPSQPNALNPLPISLTNPLNSSLTNPASVSPSPSPLPSQVGGFRTRARAGTLPLRFSNSSFGLDFLGSQLNATQVPLMQQVQPVPQVPQIPQVPQVPQVSQVPQVPQVPQVSQVSQVPQVLQIPLVMPNPPRRMRLGLLFGIDSLIWGEDPPEVLRIRSYTTSNALSDKQYHLAGQIPEAPPVRVRRARAQTVAEPDRAVPLMRVRARLVDAADGIEYTLSFQTATLLPTNTLILTGLPLPASGVTTAGAVYGLALTFGEVKAVYVIEEGALVEFEGLEAAMAAKAQLNHQELHPGHVCIIGFARITRNRYDEDSNPGSAGSGGPDVDHEPERKNLLLRTEPRLFAQVLGEVKSVMKLLQGDPSLVNHIIEGALAYNGSDTEFGALPTPLAHREFDAPKLREIRKLADLGQLSQRDLEQIALAMWEELPELLSDYMGNTIVQKLFEECSEPIKDVMMRRVAPYISQMGIHKNGTWAGQKMIHLSKTVRQKTMVRKALYPHVAPLFKDGFGNYLVQGCLKFGAPYSDFIFEAICAKFWVLAQDRYGLRAIRAVLESGACSAEQTRLLAALIVAYAEHLAINSNGLLLLTWFLDTFTAPERHFVLAQQLVPWLVELSYNKLGSLTVLKILNHRSDPRAGELILHALYGDLQKADAPPDTLRQILKEFTYGPTFVLKTLSTPLVVEGGLRGAVVHQVKHALINMGVTPYQQGYKRLMEEVGLNPKEPVNQARYYAHRPGNGRPLAPLQTNGGRYVPQNLPYASPMDFVYPGYGYKMYGYEGYDQLAPAMDGMNLGGPYNGLR